MPETKTIRNSELGPIGSPAPAVAPVSPAGPETPADAVGRFLDALTRADFDALEACLSPDVWLRVLLPRRIHESRTSAEAAATFREWFGTARELRVLAVDRHTTAGREYLGYRFLLRPEWAPQRWHLIEQVGFGRIQDGRLRRLDLVCSGFHPTETGRGRDRATGSRRSGDEISSGTGSRPSAHEGLEGASSFFRVS